MRVALFAGLASVASLVAVSASSPAEAQAFPGGTDGWIKMGEAAAVETPESLISYINEKGNETSPPGEPPNAGSRVTGAACRGWARDIAVGYLKVPKDAVGDTENAWPSMGDEGFSSTLERGVRIRWNRWTTTEWVTVGYFLGKPVKKPEVRGHCRVDIQPFKHEMRLLSGQPMKNGDLMFWIRPNASSDPDATGGSIQAASSKLSWVPPQISGKAGHVAMCGGTNAVGDCATVFQADSYSTLEGMIGHRTNWQYNVAEYTYNALRNGLDKTGVAKNSATLAMNRTRNLYVYRSCDRRRAERALKRFNDRFVNPATWLPASDRLYWVKAFTQPGQYGQCAATANTMWDFAKIEGGNAFNVAGNTARVAYINPVTGAAVMSNAGDYELMVEEAWNNARDFLDNKVRGVKDMVFNERRTASVIMHAFTDTGKSWYDLNPMFGSDKKSIDFAKSSAIAKNPDGLKDINAAVVQWASIDQYSALGCHTAPIGPATTYTGEGAFLPGGACSTGTGWVPDGEGGVISCGYPEVGVTDPVPSEPGWDLEPVEGVADSDVLSGEGEPGVCVADSVEAYGPNLSSDGCGVALPTVPEE